MKKLLKTLLTLLCCLSLMQGRAQGYEIRNLITDFHAVGDGVHDDSQAFAEASEFFNNRHGYGKLVIPTGTYRVGLQLPVGKQPAYVNSPYYLYGMFMLNLNGCSHLTIQGGANAVIKYRDGLLFGTFEADGTPCTSNCYGNQAKTASIGSFFNIVDSDSLTIKNLQLDGNNVNFNLGAANQADGYQIDHDGINILGTSHDIAITGVSAHNFGRDGIQLVLTTPNGISSPSNNIVLRDCAFEYNSRQGLSWVGGVGVTAANCKFSHTGRARFSSNPASGIDFEPEVGVVANGYFADCEFNQNVGEGIISDGGIRPTALAMESIHFDRSFFQGNSDRSIIMRGRSRVSFANCHVAGSVLYSNYATKQVEAIKFINTDFTDTFDGQVSGSGNAILEFPQYYDSINSRPVMANYAYFNACAFTTQHKMLMYVENTPYNEGKCDYYDFTKFIVFEGGNWRYNPETAPKELSYMRGASFMGNWTMGPLSTPTLPSLHRWRDMVIQSENGAGATTLLPDLATYIVGCAGLVIGATEEEAADLVVERGNTLFIDGNGQLAVRKNGTITVKAGGRLWMNQSSQLYFRGTIRVEDGATLSIHDNIYIRASACTNELYIAPGAIVDMKTDFSGTNIKVTGGKPGIISGCPSNGNVRLANSPLATSQDAKVEQATGYPNPFHNEVVLNLPASTSTTALQVVDMKGSVVYKQQVAAGTTKVSIGGELATGLYSVLVQSVEGMSVLRIEKN